MSSAIHTAKCCLKKEGVIAVFSCQTRAHRTMSPFIKGTYIPNTNIDLKDMTMINMMNTNDYRASNIKSTVNDIAFYIQFTLQMSKGGELTTALGYPDLSTNDAAVKHWISDHYEDYLGLERAELIQMITDDMSKQISDYFGGYGHQVYS